MRKTTKNSGEKIRIALDGMFGEDKIVDAAPSIGQVRDTKTLQCSTLFIWIRKRTTHDKAALLMVWDDIAFIQTSLRKHG